MPDAAAPATSELTHFALVPERSTIVVAARSSVGPINFTGQGPVGDFACVVAGDQIDLSTPPAGSMTLQVAELSSGNAVYDAELARRIDARRYPTTTIALLGATSAAAEGRVELMASLDFHGVTRPVDGVVTAEVFDGERVVVTGEKVIDIRDFEIPSPQMLLLKIYPTVRVHLFLEATKV